MTEYILYWYDFGGYPQKQSTIAASLDEACRNLNVPQRELAYYETIEDGKFTGHKVY